MSRPPRVETCTNAVRSVSGATRASAVPDAVVWYASHRPSGDGVGNSSATGVASRTTGLAAASPIVTDMRSSCA